jgi:hypothetical protein
MKAWHEESGIAAVFGLIALQERYSRDWAWRRSMARRLSARYHGRDVHNYPAMGTMGDNRVAWANEYFDEPVPLLQNQYNQYTETFVSKVGAVDAPKTALVVTEGDWDLKRRVINCSRLLEAEAQMRQGRFPNIHKLAEQALRIAYSSTGTVAAKVYPWPNEKRVVVELHDTLDMFLDDTELTYGAPLTYGELTWWNPTLLRMRFPDLKPDDIHPEAPLDRAGLSFAGRAQQTELVAVFEGWRMQVGDNVGRHVAGLRSGKVLVDEPWEQDEPPFAFLHLMPQLFGFWALPPLDLVDAEICRSNEILARCDEAEFDTSKQIHYVHEGSIESIGDLVETHTCKFVRVKNPNYQPTISTPVPFDRISLELKAQHDQAIAKALGIDEMHVAARREPGLDSGVAQREASQRFDSRFASQHRSYTQFVAVDMARLMLRAQKKLYETENITRRWTGDMFSKDIKSDDFVELDLDALQVQAKPISELKNTPEERIQYAQELLDRNAIPLESFIAALQTYDTPGETRNVKTQRRWIAKQIDRWLMADDSEVLEGEFYQGPRPWIRAGDALVQVTDSLMDAEIDGVPQERLDFFLNFIAELAPMVKASTGATGTGMLPSAAASPFGSAAGLMAGGASTGMPVPGMPPVGMPPVGMA